MKIRVRPEISVSYLQNALINVVKYDSIDIEHDMMGNIVINLEYVNQWGSTRYRGRQIFPIQYFNDEGFVESLIRRIRNESNCVYESEVVGRTYLTTV